MSKDGKIEVRLQLAITESQLMCILLGGSMELECTSYSATGTIGGSSQKDTLSLEDNSCCGVLHQQSAAVKYDDFEVKMICLIRNDQWGMRDEQATLTIKCDNWYEFREEGEKTPRYSAEAVLHTQVKKWFVENFRQYNINLNVQTID